MYINANQAIYEDIIRRGTQLADRPGTEGGFSHLFSVDESTGLDFSMSDRPVLRAQTAVLLENAARYIASVTGARRRGDRLEINEATRSAVLGGFADYILPTVRIAAPSNILVDICSFQPTTRKVATISYLHFAVGRTRGAFAAGTRLNDALRGYSQTADGFTSDTIENEQLTVVRSNAGGASNDTITGRLEYSSGGGVTPGSVVIVAPTSVTAGGAVFEDNNRGGFVSRTPGNTLDGSVASTIDYRTGNFTIVLDSGAATFTGTTGAANYRYDMEGSPDVAEIDVQPEVESVQTVTRKVRSNVTREAEYDVQMEMGESVMQLLSENIVSQLNTDVAREGIRRMWEASGTAVASFSKAVPSGVSRTEYYDGLLYLIDLASQRVYDSTQRAYANFLVVDSAAAVVIRSMSRFKPAPTPGNVNGPHFIGTLNDTYRVYLDIRLANLSGNAQGTILLGYKGNSFMEAGLVYSPYQTLIMTNPLETADFNTQRGFATRYAMKLVNPGMYANLSLAA